MGKPCAATTTPAVARGVRGLGPGRRGLARGVKNGRRNCMQQIPLGFKSGWWAPLSSSRAKPAAKRLTTTACVPPANEPTNSTPPEKRNSSVNGNAPEATAEDGETAALDVVDLEALKKNIKDLKTEIASLTIEKAELEAEMEAKAEAAVRKREEAALEREEAVQATEKAKEAKERELEQQQVIELLEATIKAEMEKEDEEEKETKPVAEPQDETEEQKVASAEAPGDSSPAAAGTDLLPQGDAQAGGALQEAEYISNQAELKKLRSALADAVRARSEAREQRDELEEEAVGLMVKAEELEMEASLLEEEVDVGYVSCEKCTTEELKLAGVMEALEEQLAQKKLEETEAAEAAVEAVGSALPETEPRGVTDEKTVPGGDAGLVGTEPTIEEEKKAPVKEDALVETKVKSLVSTPVEEEEKEPRPLPVSPKLIAVAMFGLAWFGLLMLPEVRGSLEAIAVMISQAIQAIAAQVTQLAQPVIDALGPSDAGAAHGTHEAGGAPTLADMVWVLLASVVAVPLFQSMPGGSPVLGYLAAGAILGPSVTGIVKNVHGIEQLGEIGVVFLLFNIGLELSWERLSSMRRFVFGLGLGQVLLTSLFVAAAAAALAGVSGPGSIVIGGALALSSTAVALQVLAERNENQTRHGRAAFSVLLLQDLAVVVLLMLIPLLAPQDGGAMHLGVIAKALGLAAVKAIAAMFGIITLGRLILRPAFKRIADSGNEDIFSAATILVVLGTSILTQVAGLSMALGAFLAGLLMAETEYHLQVEADIRPYKGLLLGLFFMTVGMNMDPSLMAKEWPVIIAGIIALVVGKTAVIAGVGRLFGLSFTSAVRAGLLLAPGGEFAFVAFGEAVAFNVISAELSATLFLTVALSMAILPFLAQLGGVLGKRMEKTEMKSMSPSETETNDLSGHIIIAGYGRIGKIIMKLMSENRIGCVGLDVRSDSISLAKKNNVPVYFGDAGSPQVLRSVGADRALAAVICLDTPGANYRTAWNFKKNFPNCKLYVRAHDVAHGVLLEKLGATAVIPETLEPSLQLAAAILREQLRMPKDEVVGMIEDFRTLHLEDLQTQGYKYSTSGGADGRKMQGGKTDADSGSTKADAQAEVVGA